MWDKKARMIKQLKAENQNIRDDKFRLFGILKRVCVESGFFMGDRGEKDDFNDEVGGKLVRHICRLYWRSQEYNPTINVTFIKPCPWCGSGNIEPYYFSGEWTMECKGCQAMGPKGNTFRGAIAAWNNEPNRKGK